VQPEQFEKVEAIFHALVDLPVAERRARLRELCEGDAEVEQQVSSLLTHSGNRVDNIDRAVSSAALVLGDESESLEGTTVGPYRIAGKIGEGGMGEIYTAIQTEPIEREVALKVVRSDRVSPRMLARFEAELANLSLMQHDAIAQVYDAGETPDGRPYFVMEKVGGAPLMEFCEAEGLDLASRLSLFLTVCSAVNHAHQRGVIHRDLKPSNILVSRDEKRLSVKVIDFGIAKAITEDTGQHGHTVVGQILGSPDYMSPEQANTHGVDVDIRADVYALGAVLYELLTGIPPLRLSRVTGQLELLRAIAEDVPDRPSVRVRESGAADVEQRAKALRGDLDWIVLKALAKERAVRYDTVADFAADIERHLHDQPVIAHPPGYLYRLGKFSRRHPTGVAVSAVSVVLLMVGFIGTLWGLQAAQRAEALAERRAASSEQAVTYLLDMFSNANPEFHQGERVTVEALIAEAAEDSNNLFAEEPHLRVELQYRLAEVMSRMGDYDGALELGMRALAADQQSPGYPSPATMQGVQTLVRTYMSQSRYREALALLDEIDPYIERLPPELQEVARANATYARASASFYVSGSKLVGLGILGHDQSEPLRLARKAVSLYREVAPASLALADSLNLVGYNLTYTPQNDEAFAPLLEALEIKEKLFGTRHTSLITTLNDLADAHISARQFDEALAYIERSREIAESTYPPDAPMHYSGYGQYAAYLYESGQIVEAVDAYKTIINRRDASSGNYYHLLAYQYLVTGLMVLGRLDEAAGYLNEASTITHQSELEWGLTRIYFGFSNIALMKGQVDESLRYLEIGIELAADDYNLENLPLYAPLYDDPRYKALVQKHKTIVAEGTALSAGEHNLKYHPELVSSDQDQPLFTHQPE
jgi:non-specific serine/threonine protein kinase/serine/threonine-protein kinase